MKKRTMSNSFVSFATLALFSLLAVQCYAEESAPFSWEDFGMTGPVEACKPDNTVVPDVNLTQLVGPWVEAFRQPYPIEMFSRCTKGAVTYDDDENILTINVQTSRFGGVESYKGVANPDPAVPAKLFVKWSFPPRPTLPFFILDTDYDKYFVAYACMEVRILKYKIRQQKFAWIFTRRPEDAVSFDVPKATQALARVGIDIHTLQPVVQNIC